MAERKKRWAIYHDFQYRYDSDDDRGNSLDKDGNLEAMATLAEVLEKGNENNNTFRLMVIGCFGQGKTSLVRKLLGKTSVEPQSTNGIEIHACIGDSTGQEWVEKPLIAPDDDFVHRLVPAARKLPENKVSGFADAGTRVCDSPPSDHQMTAGVYTNNTSDATRSHQQSTETCMPLGQHKSRHRAFTTGSKPALKDRVDPEQIRHKSRLKMKSKSEAFTVFHPGLCRKFNRVLKNDKQCRDLLTGINVWDFGGEFVFYATHQLFLCRHAVYLLVFRLDVSLDDVIPDDEYPGSVRPHQRTMRDYIEFWMSSVHAFVGDADGKSPTIILVGTHKDKLINEDIAKEYFESIRRMFDERIMRHHIYKECFDVSSIDDSDPNINKLRKAIMDIYNKQIKLFKVPVKWIPLENSLGTCREQDVLSLEEVIDLDERGGYPIGRQQVKSFLQHHHDIGTVFFIPDGTHPDGTPAAYVILNPQFIADAFKCVVTAKKFFLSVPNLRELWKKLSDKAILIPTLLDSVWDGPRFSKHKHLLRECLVKLRVMGKALRFEANGNFTPLNYFVVPSLLRSHSEDEVRNFLEHKPRTSVSLLYEFKDEAILPTIYHRFTAAAIGTWPILKYGAKDMLFTNCSAYKLDNVHSGLIKQERNCLEILVVQLCTDQQVAKKVPDYFRRFFEYVLHDIIRSPKRRTHNPVTKCFKCMHTIHGDKGTVERYTIEGLDPMEIVSCPDHESHPGIPIADVLETWFGYGHSPMESNIPRRTLSDKEMAILSGAIGDNWQILGYCLGLDPVAIQHITQDNQSVSMKIWNMLQRWSRKKGSCATLDVLVKALYDNENIKYNPDVVRNVIDGFIEK